jgi:hypothetical protein
LNSYPTGFPAREVPTCLFRILDVVWLKDGVVPSMAKLADGEM